MKVEDMKIWLAEKPNHVEEFTVISNGWWTLFTLSTTDSSVLEYLNNNGFPVVYSDIFDGIILVKFS
ncbi:MAG: hypothetical protein WA061_02080 [Microgenomates group bacterium]